MHIDENGDVNGELSAALGHQDHDAQAGFRAHHDGPADLIAFDEPGHALGHARLDPACDWISFDAADLPGAHPRAAADPAALRLGDDPANTQNPGAENAAGPDLRVDTPAGPKAVGPATEDTDGDGTPDTAVVTTADGGMILYTDKDGDGEVDQATEIGPDAHVTVTVHTGSGVWQVVQRGHLDGHGQYVADPRSSAGASAGSGDPAAEVLGWAVDGGVAAFAATDALGPVHIDPATGTWVSGESGAGVSEA